MGLSPVTVALLNPDSLYTPWGSSENEGSSAVKVLLGA